MESLNRGLHTKLVSMKGEFSPIPAPPIETKYQKSCLLTNRSDKQFSMCTLLVFPLNNILHLANMLESPL